MAKKYGKYLDQAGLATLWSRIQELIYNCRVTYTLEVSDDNKVTLVGSDGTRSTVSVGACAVCDNE